MRVRRIGWLGIRTERFEETARFFRDVMGLASVDEEPNFAMLQLPSGERDYLEVFGADAEDSAFEAKYYLTGPVPGFLVPDIEEARDELAAAGVELLGEISWARATPGYGWFHFRGPDGNVYGVLQEGDGG